MSHHPVSGDISSCLPRAHGLGSTPFSNDEAVPYEAARSALADNLPDPHPRMPKATARRGTRRMAPEVRAAIGSVLTRARALELMAAGEIDHSGCTVVWNVADKPVKHPIAQAKLPADEDLRPVRRLGTYKGAASRIAMYPVMRGREVTMLELESRLELHHVMALSLDRRVTDIWAQPFLMVWRHEEGSLVHVPDLAAVRDGELRVFDVKPDERAQDDHVRLVMDLVGRSLHVAHVRFEVLGSMPMQRQINLARLSRYRWTSPTLNAICVSVSERMPQTIGGLHVLVAEHLALPSADGYPDTDSRTLLSVDVALYALAQGFSTADLDAPLDWATGLTWSNGGAPE